MTSRFGVPGSTEPPLLDMAASFVRTALTDPAGLPEEETRRVGDWALGAGARLDPRSAEPRPDPLPYAVGGLDYIIESLNPSLETRETMAATLTLLGRHLAERADEMEARCQADDADARTYSRAVARVNSALDLLDDAIVLLAPEDAE